VCNRLQTLFPKKSIYSVTNTYNQIFDEEQNWKDDIKLPYFSGKTILTISASYPHKNLDVIPSIIAYLKQYRSEFDFRFVLTVDTSDLDIEDMMISDHIIFLGKTSIDQCPNLYRQSDFMFLPTLLECFSASYPEAMKMRVPILTSNLPFAKGICGDAAIY